MSSGRTSCPTLLTIYGETPGKVYDLDRDSIVIGRDGSCDIVLNRKFVSRKHARIVRLADGYAIEDLGSNCGTLVQGERIGARVPLIDGQDIRIGNYLFVFNLPSVAVTEDGDTSSTILGVLNVARPGDATLPTVRPEEKLRHVLEISRKLGESLQLGDVLEKTLETLFKVFPQADRGFVLLKDGEEVDLTPCAIKFRGPGTNNLTISRTILNHVMNEAQAILSSDTAIDGRFRTSHSIVGLIRMMMCVPLLDHDRKPVGILQLDTREDRGTFTTEDLDLLVAVASQVGVAMENARLHTALIERSIIAQESQDANEVQLALLPDKRPELAGYEFWDYYEPALFVGGDYFDYLPLVHPEPQGEAPPRRWLLAVADVAGKGMAAALLMARLSAEVRLFALTLSDPARIVERLNRDFCHRSIGERFITSLLVTIDAEAHRISVVTAGHAAPIVRHADMSLEVVGEGQTSQPLGIDQETSFSSSVAAIAPGDLVVLYTDGLLDALDASGKAFGIERLHQLLRSVPGGATEVGREVIRVVREHASGCRQSDDITFLCFSRSEAEAP